MGQFGIGQPVRRSEDPRLLRGAGNFIDDVRLPLCLNGYVVRAPFANAKIRIGDLAAARAANGVHLVLTGADFAASGLGDMSPRIPRQQRDGSPAFMRPHAALVETQARYVGDNVAFIVADTLNQAKDAAEILEIDYDPLPAVVDMRDATAPGAPAVWEERPDNIAFVHDQGDRAAVEAAFKGAARTVTHDFTINRLTANPIETRRCIADYDAKADRYTLWASVQGPHIARTALAGQVLREPHHKLRVICQHMGGGFGMKGSIYNEYVLCLWATKLTGRPVRWVADRSESFLSDDHARDNATNADLALDDSGQILALRVRTLVNIGAYYNTDRVSLSPTINLGVLAGTYTTPVIHVEVSGVMTNTRMTGPYRGAGRPEAAYVIETL
ncbi:MAG: molybdopterin-dependent oxidoreductase, partial [Alphaproteobacteria bacterium]|nr:molybdopterin-dependent oxidoreductase [Alphaproteobacteria bacterium]